MLAALALLVISPFVAASGLSLPQPADGAFALALLLPRQQAPTGNVPNECKSICDPINAQVQTPQSCPPSACCLPSFVQGYFDCLKCVGAALNFTDYTPAQNTLDSLVQQCTLKGFSVPNLTLPGIHRSSSLSRTPSVSTRSAGQQPPPPTLPVGTLSILSTQPPILPPPLPTTSPIEQSTVTSVDPLNTPTPQGPTQTDIPTSSSSHCLSAPQFSHLSILSVWLVGLALSMV